MRRRRVLQMIGAAVPAFAARPMRLANAAELDEVRVGTPLTISDAVDNETVGVGDVVDDSYVEAALKTLGPYKPA